MEIETHWWGIEVKFTKEEKEKIVKLSDLTAGGIAVPALLETLEGFAAAAAGATVGAPVLGVIACILALMVAELTACNLLGHGGFRICIIWLVITLLPALGHVTASPLANF